MCSLMTKKAYFSTCECPILFTKSWIYSVINFLCCLKKSYMMTNVQVLYSSPKKHIVAHLHVNYHSYTPLLIKLLSFYVLWTMLVCTSFILYLLFPDYRIFSHTWILWLYKGFTENITKNMNMIYTRYL